MALKYSANKLQLLVPTAKRHTQAKFTQDNISVRPSNVDKVVKAIYEDLEDISASLGITQSFVSLTDTPSEYTDVGNMLIGVNDTEDGVEFKDWAISASTLYPSGTSGDLGKEGNGIEKIFFGNSGNIDYQQDLSILSAGVQKAVFKQTTGYLGLGVNNPLEPIHSSNGIVIGNAVQSTPGTIRYFEGDFKGYDGTDWKSFTILPEEYFNTLTNDSDDITPGSSNLFLTTDEQTKLSNISITQSVDLDALESDVTTNNAKVSNANHSGDMSGSTTLTAQPELITNKTSVSATALDSLLISDQSDSNNLKKITVQSILDLTPTPDWGNIGGTLSAQTDLQTALDDKQDTLVSGTNIKTINGESLLGSTDITINSQNLGTNDLTQVDATRTYEMGTGNRILRFLSNAVEKIIFNTASGSPTLQANKSGNGPAIKANKTSGSGSAFEVVGGTSDFGSNKLINVADPTNSQDASTKAYADTKNINAYDDADVSPLTRRTKYRAVEYIEFEDDAVNSETKIQLRADSIKDAEVTRFGENGSGNIDLKIGEKRLPTGDANGFATEYTAVSECILGLDSNSEVKEFEAVEIYNILKEDAVTSNKQLALLDINGNSANVKAKFEISAIAVQNTTANAVTISIGSTALGTNVANAVVIGASSVLKLPLGTTFFSITSGQNLFISSALWNSASINIHVTISKIWQ